MKLKSVLGYRSLFLITMLLSLIWGQGIPILAQTPADELVSPNSLINPSELVRQGVELYRQGDYQTAIANWQDALASYQQVENVANQATVQENIARAYQKLGDSTSALANWEQTVTLYRNLGNQQKVGRSLTEQAQVYSSLGQQRKAIALLCGTTTAECLPDTAIALAQAQQDSLGEAAAVGSLGEIYRLRGNYPQALQNLETSLQLAKQLDNPNYQISALNGLGNTYKSLGQVADRRANSARLTGRSQEVTIFQAQAQDNYQKAIARYQASRQLASQQPDNLGEMRSLLNTISLYFLTKQPALAQQTKTEALALLDSLDASRETAFATIKLAKITPTGILKPTECLPASELATAEDLLQRSLAMSRQLGDRRGQSFALGELGHLFECRFATSQAAVDYQQAKKYTQEARLIAEQNLAAQDVLYLWEWQTARILKANNETITARAAYQRAIATLEMIRDDILSSNRDLQYDFRDAVEPIYRNLMGLQLADVPPATLLERRTIPSQNLDSFLTTFDALKLAELQNYFGDDCVLEVVNNQRIDELEDNQGTAVFSSVIFDNRTGIVVSFPNGSKKINWLEQDEATLRRDINSYRFELESFFKPSFDTTTAESIYNWLIAPFAQDLQQAGIQTLVFVQDGILRSVPMAALYDGEQFLIQEYAIATTPSLTLTKPQVIEREQITALALGLTEAAQLDDGKVFSALPNVEREIKIVDTKLSGSTALLNEQFTQDRLQQELNENVYPIVHIATHGQFSGEPDNTFLVTGDGQKLTITQLDRLIRNTPEGAANIDLLFLTACQTAVGDDRAALGLAGVALQAGVKSALASLWYISDNKTPELVEEFYASLQNPNITKAQALQQAQIKLIANGEHPAIWSPFILIGNWL